MKVIWQAADVKKGIQVGQNISPPSTHFILYQQHDDGVRYCLTLEHDALSHAMTRAEMATYLNEHGYQPTILLTL